MKSHRVLRSEQRLVVITTTTEAIAQQTASAEARRSRALVVTNERVDRDTRFDRSLARRISRRRNGIPVFGSGFRLFEGHIDSKAVVRRLDEARRLQSIGETSHSFIVGADERIGRIAVTTDAQGDHEFLMGSGTHLGGPTLLVERVASSRTLRFASWLSPSKSRTRGIDHASAFSGTIRAPRCFVAVPLRGTQ